MSDLGTPDIGSATTGHYGADGTGVTLSEASIAAMWQLQGDAANPALVAHLRDFFSATLPAVPNTTSVGGGLLALWLGPRSWLLVESSTSGQPSILTDFGVKGDALNALGAALFEVSASRVAYRIEGTHAADVFAKSCPLDFDPETFSTGGCAQSMFGRINVLFYRQRSAEAFLVFVARSLARDTWRLLCRSSAQYGYDVVAPRPAGDAF